MANRTSGNIFYIDQFNADVALAAVDLPFIVRKIRMKSAVDGDVFQLEDIAGNILLPMVQTGAGDIVEVDFGDEGFNFGNRGVIIDVSDCTGMTAVDGTDAVWIYMK